MAMLWYFHIVMLFTFCHFKAYATLHFIACLKKLIIKYVIVIKFMMPLCFIYVTQAFSWVLSHTRIHDLQLRTTIFMPRSAKIRFCNFENCDDAPWAEFCTDLSPYSHFPLVMFSQISQILKVLVSGMMDQMPTGFNPVMPNGSNCTYVPRRGCKK